MRVPTFLAAVGLAVLSAPSVALGADGDVCDPNTPAKASIYAPTQLAVGRSAPIVIKEALRNYDALAGQIRISSAEPARPISHPVTSQEGLLLEASPESSGFHPSESNHVALVFGSGDGPALITATWKEKVVNPAQPRAYFYCTRTATTTVTPIDGALPQPDISRNTYGGLVVSMKWLAPCAVSWGLPVTLTVKATGQKAAVTWVDACNVQANWNTYDNTGQFSTTGKPKGKRFLVDLDNEDYDGSALVWAKPKGRTVRRIDWSLGSGPHVFAKGKFWARSTPGSSRVIDQDEDDFVNVCINDTRTIHKAGGELYCVDSTPAEVRYFFKKKPKTVRARR